MLLTVQNIKLTDVVRLINVQCMLEIYRMQTLDVTSANLLKLRLRSF